MTIRRALSVTTTVAATVPIDPPRAIPPGSFLDPSPHSSQHAASTPPSAAKFRVGSGVTY